jgi:hypothetical protein
MMPIIFIPSPFVCCIHGRTCPSRRGFFIQSFPDLFAHGFFDCLYSDCREVPFRHTVDRMDLDVVIIDADLPVLAAIADIEDLVLDLVIVIEKN